MICKMSYCLSQQCSTIQVDHALYLIAAAQTKKDLTPNISLAIPAPDKLLTKPVPRLLLYMIKNLKILCCQLLNINDY